jgi:hypothetical protein
MFNFFKDANVKINLAKQAIYSLTFSAIVCSPNNSTILPSNHTFIDIFYFFFIFLFLFIYVIILKIFKLKKIEYLSYTFFLLLLLDFIRLKYQLFAFANLSNYIYFIFLVLLFFSFFFFRKIFIKNHFYIFELLGKFSWIFIIFFSPYILFFAYQNLQNNYNEYTFGKKISSITNTHQVYKKNLLIIVFDELDNKILNLELDNLPAFKKLIKESTKYENIIIPGTETIDVIPNLLSMNSYAYGSKDSHLDFKNKVSYINYFNEIKKDNKSLFFLLNSKKKELFIFGFYHKYCILFKGQYGDCYEMKYKKAPAYRFFVDNSEILDSHINHLDLYYKLTNYFLNSESLKSGFFHLRLPHGPFIYDHKKKQYKFVANSEEGYYGNLLLADRYLDFLLEQQEKYKFNLIIMSDHGYRDKYKDVENVEKLDYINTTGRSVLIFKNVNLKRNKIIVKKIKLVDAFKNILNETKKN